MGRPRSAPSRSTGLSTSIHAPHAWGDGAVLDEYGQMRTSIHAPHAWGDLSLQTCSQGHPTSIHAPHAWGDQNGYICFGSFFDFNPRPICVGRPFVVYIITYTFKLQSTPHMRGATDSASRDFRTSRTSIHAPHAWGDSYILCNFHNIQHFLSFYLIKSIISISNILYDKKSKVRNR